MAKLTARGATVVAKVKVVTEAGTKMQYALRSDGKVLVKAEWDSSYKVLGSMKASAEKGPLSAARLAKVAKGRSGPGATVRVA